MEQRNYNGETMKTITVAELIELLQDQNPDAKVIFSADYGDCHHTEQALPLRGETEEVTIEKSAYSKSGFAVDSTDEDYNDEDGDGEEEEAKPVYLVIR